MEKQTCLFLGRSEDPRLRDYLMQFLLPEGIHLITLDLAHGTGYGEPIPIFSDSIYRVLERADLVIADITENDPNVMYELGFAHALKKPVLPLVQRGSGPIPSDLKGYLFYVYDIQNVRDLGRVVTDWVRRNRERIKNP